MQLRSRFRRRGINIFTSVNAFLSAIVGIVFLAWILYVALSRGIAAFNWAFFTELPAPPGMAGGGLANAILGTVMITVMSSVIGIPIGLLAGIYLTEFNRSGRIADSVRFSVNMLMGVPSILMGLFVWGLIVTTFGSFSAWAGAISLALIMLPVVARTTEDMLKLVPDTFRESVLAMGASKLRSLSIILRAAKRGLITGILLAVARVSGETAPLLFTSLNSPYWPTHPSEATANLTVTIFNYAMSPYPDWHTKAWGASLLITIAVLGMSIMVRLFFRQGEKR